MLCALILAATLADTVIGPPNMSPLTTWEPSPEAARAILERMEADERRIAALERLRDDLRGWPHDTGAVVIGAAVDMLSTGAFRDQPERGLVEGNSLIGNGPGAAEKHVALKAFGVVAVSAICYELRHSGKPKAARILSVVVGVGFAGLGVRNWAK